ncbi:hypothetical protein L596_020695 [Steinernema carpocapsae]|uniref:Uncharacterized protein n=1 Tax=Steinernema carpocapsae TaxID=34508 RepID=A0A4U5MUB2_STECR|nr:hypothetical protein L596_020695 [Steinernema carpocapsae]
MAVAQKMFLFALVILVLCLTMSSGSLYSGPLGLTDTRQGEGQSGDLLQQRLSKLWQQKQLEELKEKLKLGETNQEAIFRSLFS